MFDVSKLFGKGEWWAVFTASLMLSLLMLVAVFWKLLAIVLLVIFAIISVLAFLMFKKTSKDGDLEKIFDVTFGKGGK